MYDGRLARDRMQTATAWCAAWALLVCVGCVEDVRLASECPGPACEMGALQQLDASAGLDARLSQLDATSCADASCTCQPIAARVLAHWPLDEQSGLLARDISGGHDGTLRQASWVAGPLDGALSFDGSDDTVLVGALPDSVRAVSFWVQARSTEVTSKQTPMQLPSTHGPLDGWTNPEFAYADDNRTAIAAALIGAKAQQHWGGFHLRGVLPRGAPITGITVTIDTANLGLLGGLAIELSWDGGTSHTNSNYGWGQLILGTNLRHAGGADKLWARTWSADEFSDANFRVRATFNGIANAMSLDYVGVALSYPEQTLARTLLGLSPGVYLTFADATVRSVGWPATTYVNGTVDGALHDGWNHVALVGRAPVDATDVRLGSVTLDSLSIPLDGVLDDVRLFGGPLSSAEIQDLAAACAP